MRSPSSRRAWIEIGCRRTAACARWSPSSRRAWIEILWCCRCRRCIHVALLAEGVDRNSTSWTLMGPSTWSPSSRRAWIEIQRSSPRGTC